MATVYYRGGEKKENVPPKVGDRFWWYKSDRVLLVLTVLKTTYEEGSLAWGVHLRWDHYMGLVTIAAPEYNGEVTWDNHEWKAAHLKEFVEPVKAEDLGPDEELCHACRGMYFETERDLEILGCIWCDKDKPGTRKKSPPPPPPPPPPTQRSPLHPAVPAER